MRNIKGMNSFRPTQWNFTKLKDFEYPGGVFVYEYQNHPTVDGTPNFVRINLYLSKDKNYVTIWSGLVEPIFTEAKLKSVEKPSDFDFYGSYTEQLFRGYIDSKEAAGHILKALRIGISRRHSLPQILSGGADNKLRCDLVEAV